MSKRVATSAQLKATVSKDAVFYSFIETAEKKERERKKEIARENVYWHFLEEVRPKLKVGQTYTFTELQDLYPKTRSEEVGLFSYLLLNNSEYLDVRHTCARPDYIIFTKKPTNGVKNYFKNREEITKKAYDFMEETGLKVELPPEISENWISIIEETAQKVPIEKVTKLSNTGLITEMLKSLKKMGYEYKRIKMESAFWIEE